MILWFVACAIVSSAAFLVLPDRRGSGAMAIRGLAVAVGTLLLVMLPFTWAWTDRALADNGQTLGIVSAFTAARAMLTYHAALLLLGNVFGIVLAAWIRLHHGADMPLKRLATEKLSLTLAGIMLVAVTLPWLSANKDRISSIEIASLAKLSLQPAAATQVPNATSSGGESSQTSSFDIAEYVKNARDFTREVGIVRDIDIARALPGGSQVETAEKVLAGNLRATRPLMQRLEPLLACVAEYVADMRDYRLFLVDVRPVLLSLHLVRRYQVTGWIAKQVVVDFEWAARVLAAEARQRIAAGRPIASAGAYPATSTRCDTTAPPDDSIQRLLDVADAGEPIDQLDLLNPYPVIVLAYLYAAIGSHETAVDELLAHVDRIRAQVASGMRPHQRSLLLWFALRAIIEASVLAEQDALLPQRGELMRRLLAIAVDLAGEARLPEPSEFASRCRAAEIGQSERNAAFTSLTLRLRLLQAAAATGRIGPGELDAALRLGTIDLERCFGPLLAQGDADFLRGVAATLHVTRARIKLAWSATGRIDRRVTDDEAEALVRGARDDAIAAVTQLEELTRREEGRLFPERGREIVPLATRLRRTTYEARLQEARSVLQQAVALAQ